MPEALTHSELAGLNSEPLLGDTIGAAFDQTAARYPDACALVVGHQSVRWSYREYQREVERLACGLL